MEQTGAASNEQPRAERWLYRLALLTAGATFFLVCLGGLVTSKGVGLVVPDWPTTFGYNLFLFPWAKMVGGIFYEHSHRLVGAMVGLLTLCLALALWIWEPRRWLRWLGVLALGLVITQGILGGLRVLLIEQTLAVVHGAFAHAFFALMVSVTLFTSKEWRTPPPILETTTVSRLQQLAVLTTGLFYVQVVFGAVLRHTGYRLDAHLVLALLVTLQSGLLAARILKYHTDQPKLRRPVLLLWGLLLLQLVLGVGAYLAKFTPLRASLGLDLVVLIVTTHVAIGTLLLATSVVVTLRVYRFLGLPESAPDPHLVSKQVPV